MNMLFKAAYDDESGIALFIFRPWFVRKGPTGVFC
jgi:hypothetical protein